MSRRTSEKHGRHWLLTGPGVYASQEERDAVGVGRFLILIHPANWADELQGCIAPGLHLDYMPSGSRRGLEAIGVSNSRQAMMDLAGALDGVDEWDLDITHIALDTHRNDYEP